MWNRLGHKREISCQQVETWLMAYLKEGLSPVQRQAVKEHLAACDICTRSLQEAQILDAELCVQAARHRPILASEASARIQDTVYRRMRRGLIMQRTVRFVGIAAALVAVVMLAIGATGLWQGVQPEGEELGGGKQAMPIANETESLALPSSSTSLRDGRINMLLLGIDRRGGKSWGHLTDTIIVVMVDQTNKTVGMMSVPRDLQLTIPSYGEDRINTANAHGESQGYPGGGPALVVRTIEYNFGIPIDYYIMVDFKGFEKIIDTLGGIDITVPRTLHDTKYPDPRTDDPYAYKTVHFDPGWQHMNGERALQYARSRMSTSDADRAWRQQQILLAIRETVLHSNRILELPELATTLMDSVKTDMTLEELLELARLMPNIDTANLRQVVLEEPLVYSHRREDGAAVLLPRWDLINAMLAELLSESVGPTFTAPGWLTYAHSVDGPHLPPEPGRLQP